MLPAAGTITHRWLNPIRLSYMHAPAAYSAVYTMITVGEEELTPLLLIFIVVSFKVS